MSRSRRRRLGSFRASCALALISSGVRIWKTTPRTALTIELFVTTRKRLIASTAEPSIFRHLQVHGDLLFLFFQNLVTFKAAIRLANAPSSWCKNAEASKSAFLVKGLRLHAETPSQAEATSLGSTEGWDDDCGNSKEAWLRIYADDHTFVRDSASRAYRER